MIVSFHPNRLFAPNPTHWIRLVTLGVYSFYPGEPREYPMNPALARTSHRPWPMPQTPWIMAQRWHNLLFAHWPVDASELRALLPPRLDLDLHQGQAWLGVVPFRMSGVRLRFTPSLPWLSSFPELNVRTYVTHGGKPGVWFFSLDAANSVAVSIARAWFHLPYFRARMSCRSSATLSSRTNPGSNATIAYRSIRIHRAAPPACLECVYRGDGPPFEPQPGSLDYFLTERYCLYAADPQCNLFRGEIHHPPWSLQTTEEVTFHSNTMAQAAGVTLPTVAPLLHFAKRQDMVAWSPEPLCPDQ
jgi:uncharacterized protein